MEPHSYECGNELSLYALDAGEEASMEPHSYECGNLKRHVVSGSVIFLLQWSRTLTSAEMEVSLASRRSRILLQWSRTLTSAEIGS